MKKNQELGLKNSTLDKAGDEEMLFILRGQDYTSPKIIMLWLAENIQHLSKEKAREALECALTMKDHDERKHPD